MAVEDTTATITATGETTWIEETMNVDGKAAEEVTD